MRRCDGRGKTWPLQAAEVRVARPGALKIAAPAVAIEGETVPAHAQLFTGGLPEPFTSGLAAAKITKLRKIHQKISKRP